MRNNFDYFPISPGHEISGGRHDISAGSVGYSISTHPHTRIIWLLKIIFIWNHFIYLKIHPHQALFEVFSKYIYFN